MDLEIYIKTQKNEARVIKTKFGEYEVWVKSPPVKGRANKELLEVLALYFNAKPYNFRIKKGLTSPRKIVEFAK
jgi:uncharacterized protein